MPLDSTQAPLAARNPEIARRTTRRIAVSLLLLAVTLTVMAVRWKLPFTGTAALLVVFLGGLWVVLRWLRAFRAGRR